MRKGIIEHGSSIMIMNGNSISTAIPYGNNQTKYKEGHVNIDSKERIKYNNDTD